MSCFLTPQLLGQVVLVQLNKTSDEAIALSLYSVSGFFLEKTQMFWALGAGGILVATGEIGDDW